MFSLPPPADLLLKAKQNIKPQVVEGNIQTEAYLLSSCQAGRWAF